MAKPIPMPRMGYDMSEGTLLRWLKHEGDRVERGEPIAEIETDKVNLEIESFESGVLLKLLAKEGDVVPVGQPIALIGEPGESVEETPAATPTSTQADGKAAAPATAAVPGPQSQDVELTTAVAERAPGERVRASPLVRRLAAEHGIDLSTVRGSGPGGRIIKEDILALIARPAAAQAPAAQPAAPQEAPAAPAAPAVAPSAPTAAPATPEPVPGLPPFEVIDLTRMRQTIARRMAESFQQAPHFFVTTVVELDAALALRQQINAQVDDEEKVSVTDLLVKACALALREHPRLNASYAGTQLRVYRRIDIGIAVALEDGLLTPIIIDADHKPLGEIARVSKDLINRARTGELRPEEYQGGTFTISNLGMFGLVEHFTAVINPPQAAILAVGSIVREPVYHGDELVPVQRVRLTLSIDHRVADGAEAARFLSTVKHLLEHPMLLLVR